MIVLELENTSAKVAGVGYVNTVPDEKVTGGCNRVLGIGGYR